MASNRVVLAVASDLHSGSTVGIMPPKFYLDDGVLVQPSEGQRELLDYWEECWDEVFEVAGKDPLYIVLNGDLVDGDDHKHKNPQRWSHRVLDQANAAIELMNKPASQAEKLFVTRGTPSHVLQQGIVEDYIAKELGAHGLKSHYHLALDIQGLTFEFLHKWGHPGKRSYLRGNTLRYKARSEMIGALLDGESIPDVIVSSHYHTYTREWVPLGDDVVYATITPAWQGKTEWAFGAVGRKKSDIGLIWFEIEDGRFYPDAKWHRIDQKEVVTL